jgi:hypothetical protein
MNKPMSEALERGRKSFNTRFGAARKGGAMIDGEALLAHLRDVVAPIVDAVAAQMPERVDGVLNALFDVSLELFAASLLGPRSKSPVVGDVWTDLLPKLPALVMRDPKTMAAAVSNAAYRTAQTTGARTKEWLETMQRLGPQCETVAELLEVGKVEAWVVGMPQYRASALAITKTLRPALVEQMFQVPRIDRMLADPWFNANLEPGQLRQVRVVGAFRGFGGEFLRPPSVWPSDGLLFVTDDESNWRLMCDCFGSVLLRHEPRPARNDTVSDVKITSDGTVHWGAASAKFPEFTGGVSSFACDGKTLAVTLNNSHHVFLIARGSDA